MKTERLFFPVLRFHHLAQRLGAVWFAVLLLYAVSGLVPPGMFHFGQVINVLQVASFLGVVATGQTVAILLMCRWRGWSLARTEPPFRIVTVPVPPRPTSKTPESVLLGFRNDLKWPANGRDPAKTFA
jgi:hypothetical protein